jgi:hypothetical protein
MFRYDEWCLNYVVKIACVRHCVVLAQADLSVKPEPK